MMLTTHALVGLALAVPVALLEPSLAPVAFAAGAVGGVFPDLDMYAGHRRRLHFPVYYTLAAFVAGVVALASPGTVTVGIAVFLLAAAAHCLMDVLGGGLELRPWEGTSDRAVYSHFHGRWIAPRRLVAYDGSPADLALASALAIPLIVWTDGLPAVIAAAALGVSVVYVALRRRLADLAPVLAGRLPEPVREYLPARYRSTP